jgi:hypothetical protein
MGVEGSFIRSDAFSYFIFKVFIYDFEPLKPFPFLPVSIIEELLSLIDRII